MRTLAVTPEVTAFTSAVEAPMLGVLAVNSYLINDDEPILIDTGLTPEREEFMAALRTLIDPKDLKWIWLTHADRDHTGAITDVLEEAPNARVISTFITMGLMGAGNQPIPPERGYLVRNGTEVEVGHRTLVAIRPPLFDNPGTVGFFDPKSRVLFSSDFFGGVMPSQDAALAENIADVAEDDVVAGQLLWGSLDAPWAHSIDEAKFAGALDEVRRFDPEIVLSTHLPPIRNDLERHLKTIARLPSSTPTVTPDQAELEAVLAQIAH